MAPTRRQLAWDDTSFREESFLDVLRNKGLLAAFSWYCKSAALCVLLALIAFLLIPYVFWKLMKLVWSRTLISWDRVQLSRTDHEQLGLVQVLFLIVPKRNREHIIGDLEEEYRVSYERFPRLWYWEQVIIIVIRYLCVRLKRFIQFDAIFKVIRK
jgi:hypothetical protein